MKAQGEYILLEPIEEDEKTSGGIYIPDVSKLQPFARAKILSIGSRVDMVENLDVGSTILYVKKGALGYKSPDGKDLLICREQDIVLSL